VAWCGCIKSVFRHLLVDAQYADLRQLAVNILVKQLKNMACAMERLWEYAEFAAVARGVVAVMIPFLDIIKHYGRIYITV